MTVPYDVVQDVMAAISLINKGKLPSDACDDIGLSYSTFTTYCNKYPQLAELRKEAEDRLYDRMADALPRIFDHPIYGVSDPKEASVVSGNIKWLLERRRQKAYGSHSVVEHQITADKAVLDALQRAKARAQGIDILDALTETSTDILDMTVLNGIASVTPTVTHLSDDEKLANELAELS